MTDEATPPIRFVNHSVAQASGLAVHEAQGTPIGDLYTETERRRQLRARFAAASHDGHGSFEPLHLRKDGSAFSTKNDIASVRSGNASGITAAMIGPEPPARADPAPGHSETILVVEDNAPLRRVVIRQLTTFGYQSVEADNAHAALAVLCGRPISLVFTDIVMPGGMDGFELALEVHRSWPATRILLTSGFADPASGSGFGGLPPGVRLLSKPYRRDELARVLREVLDC